MIAIPEPDVVFTDLGLAALGAYLGWRLWRAQRPGVVVMLGLASAALWGAIFHAFFPAKTATPAGFAVWLLVAFSIAVVAESLLDMALRMLFARLAPGVRRTIVVGYCILFACVILFVDESFTTVTRLYAPTVLLMLGVAQYQASRPGNVRWMLISGGLALSVLAALLQQRGIAIHPVYFDHNALYHVVQAAALVLLYFGFRAVRLGAG